MITVTAVVTAYNRADYMEKCIGSLLASVEPGLISVDIIVMDNGSTDGTAEAARKVSDRVQVFRTEDNRHFPTVLNEGLAHALATGSDYIILMNDDTSLMPGCLNQLVAAAMGHPHSLLTPMQLNYWAPEHIDDVAFDSIRASRELLEDALLGRPLNMVYHMPTLVGAVLIARRETYERLGMFDALFEFYGIDDDYCNRARFIGVELLMAPAARMWHAHGRISDKREFDKAAWWRRWRQMLQARYMLRLKNPQRSLARNYLSAAAYTVTSSAYHLLKLWPKGALATWRVFGQVLLRNGAIRKRYRQDFDPAKKLSAPKSTEAA